MIFTFDVLLNLRDARVGLSVDKTRFCWVDTFHLTVSPLPFLAFHWTFKSVANGAYP